MKDIALSLLSRGCGHVVQSQLGSQDGRLEVYFEPKDYYDWKSQPSLLRLSKSGRLLGGVETGLPKTYSTRQGPLFLYYQEMAMTSSFLSSCPSGSEEIRKRQVSQHSRQEVELQLNTLRDLTGAILAYGKKQLREEEEGKDTHQPVLPLPSSHETYYPPIKPSYPRHPTKGWKRQVAPTHLEQLTDDPELCRGHVKTPCPTPATGGLCIPRSGQALSHNPYRQPQVPLPPIPEVICYTRDMSHPASGLEQQESLWRVESTRQLPGDPPHGQAAHQEVGSPVLIYPDDSVKDCEEVGGERSWPLQGGERPCLLQRGERPWPLPRGERPCSLQRGERPWPLQRGERPWPLQGGERPWPLQGGERPWPLQRGERPWPLQGGERPWPLPKGERPCPLKTASVDSSWRSCQLSHINYYGGYLGGAQQGRTLKQGNADTKKDNTSSDPSFSRFHLPPLFSGSVVSLDQDRDQDSSGRKPRSPGGLGGKFLPLIHEAYVSPEDPAQTQPERLTQTYPVHPAHTLLEPRAHPEGTHPERAHPEKPGPRRLLLSVLLPLEHTDEEEVQTPCVGVHYKPSEEERGEPHCGEMGHKRESTRREGRGGGAGGRGGGGGGGGGGAGGRGGGGGGLLEKGSKQTGPEQNGLSLLQPGEEAAVPLAVFAPLAAPLAGRLRGPGKQSSMAIYKDRSVALWDPSDAGRAMVRGSLPLELREWQQQTGKSLGTLILGPDGEVIQMSPWEPTNMSADQPALTSALDQVTRDHALQVLTSEGELPWVVLMQTQPIATGEASRPEGPPTNMEQCELVQAVGSDGQTVLSGDQRHRQEPEFSSNRSTGKQLHPDTQRPGGRHKDTAVSYSLRSGTAPVEIPRQEEGKAAREGKEVRREEAEEKSTRRKRSQNRDQPGTQMSGVSSLPTTEEEETQNISPHKSSQPLPTGHSTARDLSQKRTPKHSEGPLTPSGKGGHFKKTNVTVDEQNPQQVEGQTQETGEQTSREKLEDTLNKEVDSQDSPTVQKTTKRKVNEGQEQKQEVLSKEEQKQEVLSKEEQKQEVLSKEEQKQEVLSKEEQKQKVLSKEEQKQEVLSKEEQKQKVLSKESGKVLRKRKKDRVKSQAEFVVGKPKGHVAVEIVERTNKTKETKGLSETSPSASDGDVKDTEDDSAALNTHDEDLVQSPHSSVNRSSSSNGQSGQSSHRSNSCEDEVLPCGQRRSSHDQLSSCSVVMTAETQPLNLVISEDSISTDKNRGEAAAHMEQQKNVLAEKAERRRLEVERKRKEREEERRRQQEREEREECMRLELEEEQNQRAEELRLRRLAEEEERQRLEEKETERIRREQAEKEREWRKKEEKRRQLEMIQKIRQEEEERRAAELELQRLEEAVSKEEERRRLAAMEDHEKREYLQKQEEEEEERKKAVEERKRREEAATQWAEEEARLQAELFARQRAMLEQQLQFRRGLLTEAGALGQTQDISRAWVYSYFQLIQLLGLAEDPTAQEDSPKDMS
ncbi:uncharacterized protein KIAA2012 homolog isoform X2 [Salvelinus fontinalis]|uniref:uncharacterized protein KIAA2012 homolog isoform X2 n=1 Tax=Salvelinus fontinalis TaxID=8038 RepID=UPI0024857253|nr:uncharacterized protein KIAA2012 homolog isoform X2 [Salvelinus fontinalis]